MDISSDKHIKDYLIKEIFKLYSNYLSDYFVPVCEVIILSNKSKIIFKDYFPLRC